MERTELECALIDCNHRDRGEIAVILSGGDTGENGLEVGEWFRFRGELDVCGTGRKTTLILHKT